MKLVVREPESVALVAAIPDQAELVTSVVSLAEVARSLHAAGLVEEIEAASASGVLDGCTLIDVDPAIARAAAGLASVALRPLDAVQLASAIAVAPDLMLVYDRRLAAAAARAGIAVDAPGASM